MVKTCFISHFYTFLTVCQKRVYFFNYLSAILIINRTSPALTSESTRSYGRAYARGRRGRGGYRWSYTSVKEKVGLSAGGGGAYRWRNTLFQLTSFQLGELSLQLPPKT